MSLKTSKYNFFFKSEDGATLAFNASSGGLAKLTPDKAELVQEILASPADYNFDSPEKQDIKGKLIQGRFLINAKDDEILRLKVANRADRFNTEGLGLTIAPTLACNFRCRYCYEKAKPGSMKPAVEAALVKFVSQRLKTARVLSVTWFGGEPLLALKIIERLTKKFKALCKKNECKYSAGIVTNGYSWDRKTARKLKRWGVEGVQITLDGPKDIHDQRRPTTGGKGSFDRILANIEKTYDIIPINIRVNTDRENCHRALELLDTVQERGLKDKVKVYFARVEAYTEACANIGGSCYSSQEYSSLEVVLYRQALAKGFSISRYPHVIHGGYCTADRISGLVVAPDGHLFKCWNQISDDGSEAVGYLPDKELKPEYRINLEQWLSWDPFEKKECVDCNILPICMGGCPFNAKLHNEKEKGHCENWKYHLVDMLNLTYAGHKAFKAEDKKSLKK